ncbi:hypothetical protein PVAND_015581 [Polypedilum vanderplanki]|uniref:Arrestin C-terminal-like domain-containing protein n=1 Tax=Polypedilum vanderplanki TaxID=319348 RepID=A0A9J6BD03_POLVA|nr:hypothetical protein PVAND_015581 [Polypedilum vanderplanki]
MSDLKIELEANNNNLLVYNPGHELKGFVEFSLNEITKFRGCYIVINGIVKTNWTNPNDSSTYYQGEEILLNTKIYLFGSDDDEILEIPDGLHRYDFNSQLPESLPSTIDLIYGNISYYVEAFLEIPYEYPKETKKCFTIKRVDDLNQIQELRLAQKIEERRNFHCFCCKLGVLQITVTIPHGGFAKGQAIPINIYYRNHSSVWVNNTIIKLRRVMTFKCQIPWERTKIDEVTLIEIVRRGVTNHENINLDYNIAVPRNSVNSNARYCKIIQIEYFVRIEGIVDQFHTNIIVDIPIEIGSIGISGDETLGQMQGREIGDIDLPPTFDHALNMAAI